jgi:transmembrane sensor
LAPASRIVVTGKGASGIELARGEAYFDVRHDPSRILNISAGRYNVTDIGTRFSVAIGGPVFRVGVSEGALAVSSSDSGESVQVRAGHQIIGDDRQMTLSPVESKDIGSWRSGRLSYSDAPLSLVAADISRYAGKMVVVDPALETLHFSGTLVIGDGSKLLSDLSTVMGVAVRAEGRGVRIAPAPR